MSASPPGASRRTVTVLFCDVVDSTPLGERVDAEALQAVMHRYFDAVRAVVQRHGGTLEKFIGDAVMAVFGIPRVHEDDALRAVRAAAELPAAVGDDLRVRVGVATGEVVSGDPATGQAFATGEAVVTAERLQKAAPAGSALVDAATYRLVADAVDAEPVDPVEAKGKTAPVVAWRLVAVRSGSPGVARRFDTPLVGRERELAAMRDAFADAVARRACRLLAVVGPAGIGKSRLVREFVLEVGPAATVRRGRCLPYGDGITFWPVVEVLPDEPLGGTTDEIFWRVRKSFEQLARERPLVVCFEDVHWAEPTFLSLLDYLRALVADAPLLLVCIGRPEVLDRRPEWLAEAVVLAPLSAAESVRLLDALEAPHEARPRIAEAAEGNPLFAEQMAAMAADAGADFPLPPSIRSLLAARLDRLPGGERAVAERAAVIGREFPLRAVVALAPDELRDGVADHVLALVRKDLVEPHAGAFGEEDAFRFRHGLIRDAAYEGIPKHLRAQLHERYARWFERYGGEDIIVGYHLEQAFRLREQLGRVDDEARALAREAGELLGDAGERAYRREDVPAAVSLLERAVALLPPDAPRVPELSTELASALIKAGRLEEAERRLDEALEAARRSGDRRSELRATIEREQLRSFTEPAGADAVARVAAEVIAELEELGDDLGLAKAWRLASGVHALACRWSARAEALEHALEYATRSADAQRERSSVIGLLAQALYYGPTPAGQALDRCRGLLDEAGSDPGIRAGVLSFVGGLRAMEADFAGARESYAEAVALFDQLGLRFRRAVVALVGADIAMLEGDVSAAELELRAGYETLAAMGESGARAAVAAVLADFLCTRRLDAEAEHYAAVAADAAEADDVLPHVLHRSVVARIAARGGRIERARELAREAVELAPAGEFPSLTAAVHLALAEVAALAGNRDEARAALTQARAAYLAKGNRVAAGRVPDLAALAT